MEVIGNPAATSPRSETTAWVAVAALVVLIFTTIGLIRSLQEWIAARVGSAVFGWATVAIIGGAVAAAAVSAVLRRHRFETRPLLWLVAVAAAAVLWAAQLWQRPEEAFHLVEYGLLGLLMANALRHRVHDPTLFAAAVLAGALVGTVDELIQWIVPGRFFDFRDVWLNTGAVALAQVALWKGELVGWGRKRVRAGSLRLVVRLAIAWLPLLGFSLSATGSRLAGDLLGTDEVLAEYGHRHEVAGIGVFKSRFSLAELRELDAQHGAEAAAIIRQHRRYPEFLEAFPSHRAPFVHEARVHIFSRDRNLALARKSGDDAERRRHHLAVAHGEDQVLTRFFPRTLRLSGHSLGPLLRARIAAAAEDSGDQFTSKVSSHLITACSEQVAMTLLAATLMLLVAAERCLSLHLGRRPDGGEPPDEGA